MGDSGFDADSLRDVANRVNLDAFTDSLSRPGLVLHRFRIRSTRRSHAKVRGVFHVETRRRHGVLTCSANNGHQVKQHAATILASGLHRR
jgi:hypothetical protein